MTAPKWNDCSLWGIVLHHRASESKFQIALNKGDVVHISGELVGWHKVEVRRKRRSIEPVQLARASRSFGGCSKIAASRQYSSTYEAYSSIYDYDGYYGDHDDGLHVSHQEEEKTAENGQTSNGAAFAALLSTHSSYAHREWTHTRGLFPASFLQVISEQDAKNVLLAEENGTKAEAVERLSKSILARTDVTDESFAALALEELTQNNPLLVEVCQVLKEWITECNKFRQEKSDFAGIKKQIMLLVGLRRVILEHSLAAAAGYGSKKVIEEAIERAKKIIEEGTRSLNLDLVVRVQREGEHKGKRSDERNTDIVSLYRQYYNVHEKLSESKSKLRENTLARKTRRKTYWRKSTAIATQDALDQGASADEAEQRWAQLRESYDDLPTGNVQLLLDVKACLFTVGEPVELYFSLYSNYLHRFVTEDYRVSLTAMGMPTEEKLIGNLKNFFRDLTAAEYLSNLYLVCRIYRRGRLSLGDAKDSDRISALTMQRSSNNDESAIRRPFGLAILALTPNIISEYLSTTNKEYAPGNLQLFAVKDESQFASAHEHIINGTSPQLYERMPPAKAIGIVLGVTMVQGSFDEALREIGNQAGQYFATTNMLRFPEVVSAEVLRNDLYVTLANGQFVDKQSSVQVETKVVVRDSYSSVTSAQKCLSRFAAFGVQPRDTYHSSVYMNVTNPTWDETLRINLEPVDLEKSVVVFLLHQCSPPNKKAKSGQDSVEPLGVAFFTIFDEETGAVKQNDVYQVEVYKYVKDFEQNLVHYLFFDEYKKKLQPLGGASAGSKSNSGSGNSNGCNLSVRLHLVSTRTTQDVQLRNLFKWRELEAQGADKLAKVLDQFAYVGQDTVLVLMRETFQALFDILNQNAENEQRVEMVYRSIVRVIDSLSKRQFTKHQAVLENFIDSFFKQPTAYRWLLQRVLANLELTYDIVGEGGSQSGDTVKKIRSIAQTLKSVHYLFRFIVQSRWTMLSTMPQEAAKDEQQFQQDMRRAFERIIAIMQIQNNPQLIASQDQSLKLLAGLFEYEKLSRVFALQELGKQAAAFISSIPETSRRNTTEGKLILLNAIARSHICVHPDSRTIVLDTMIQQIQKHIVSSASQERKLAISALADLFGSMYRHAIVDKQEDESIFKEHILKLISVLTSAHATLQALAKEKDETVQKLRRLEQELQPQSQQAQAAAAGGSELMNRILLEQAMNETYLLMIDINSLQKYRGELLASVLGMLRSVSPEMLRRYVTSNANSLSMKEHVVIIMDILSMAINDSPYPAYWLEWNSFAYSCVLAALRSLSDFCKADLIPKQSSQSFDFDIWNRLFRLCIDFCECDRMRLEKFSASKQHKLVRRFGDQRIDVSLLLLQMWQTLGEKHQVHFIPNLITPVLRMSNIPIKDIAHNALNIYYGVLYREFSLSQSLRQCEGLTLECLDDYIVNGVITVERFKESFVQVLEQRFKQDGERITREGMRFLSLVREFIDLVAAVQRYNDSQEDEKVSALLKVIEYVLSAGKTALFNKYALMLCSVHEANKNYVEAALCMLLVASKLSFTSETLLPAIASNDQWNTEEPEAKRKERLYLRVIDLLDKGKDWERAIVLIRELIPIYELQTFEYKKLAELLRRQSTLVEKIVDQKRLFSAYFYTAFYGAGFRSMGLQNKSFVYKGSEAERLSDFMATIQSRFPNAEMLKPGAEPTKEMLDGTSESQHVQVFTVYPCFQEDVDRRMTPRSRNPKLPLNIASYEQSCNIRMFYSSKTFRQNPKDKTIANEFRDLFTRLTFYHVYEGAVVAEGTASSPLGKVLDSFPTIIRRKPILSKSDILLGPVENACKNIEDKNYELNELILGHSLDAKPDTQKLSMLLNGIIDAAVNGGVSKYLDAFWSAEWLRQNLQQVPLVGRLQQALRKQLELLELGLECYRKNCKANALAHVQHLTDMYGKMQKELAEPLSRDVGGSL